MEIQANLDIGMLIDVWRLKFGTRWVDDEELMQDPFYSKVADKLGSTPYFESHYLVDSGIRRTRLVERW